MGWSVVGVPDSALVPEGAGVAAAGGLSVGVRLCVGVGELLGRYGAEGSGAACGPRLANTARLRVMSFA